MSGRAGAARTGRYFSIFYHSGMYVEYAPPMPGVDPDKYLRECFESDNAKYAKVLDGVFEQLCVVFNRAISEQNMPIVEMGEAQWIDRVIEEDVPEEPLSPAQIERDAKLAAAGIPALEGERVFVELDFPLEKGEIECRIVVNQRIKRSHLHWLEEQIRVVFEG